MPRVPPKWKIVESEYKSNLGSGAYQRVITRDSPSDKVSLIFTLLGSCWPFPNFGLGGIGYALLFC